MLNRLRAWRHDLAHYLHWQFGTVVSTYDSRGALWIGFRCSHCGRVTGKHVPDEPADSDFRQ
jgi:hypothetical protein